MNSFLRQLCFLPVFILMLISFSQGVLKGPLYFTLWVYAVIISALVCLPIVLKTTHRYVPIYQIFTLLIATVLIFIIIFYFEFSRYLNPSRTLFFSIVAGLISMGLIMFLRLRSKKWLEAKNLSSLQKV